MSSILPSLDTFREALALVAGGLLFLAAGYVLGRRRLPPSSSDSRWSIDIDDGRKDPR